MNKVEFAEIISDRLSPYLTPLGFSYAKSKGAFVKKQKDGWIRITIVFYEFATAYNFEMSFALRKNIIEELVVKYVDMNPSDHKNSSTVLFILSNLLGYQYKEGKFEFTEDKGLDEIIEKDVIPFLQYKVPVYSEQYNKLECIYELFVNPGEENYKFIHFGYENCIRALVTGFLIYSNNFNKVINDCRSRMLKVKEEKPYSFDVELFDKNFENIISLLEGTRGK